MASESNSLASKIYVPVSLRLLNASRSQMKWEGDELWSIDLRASPQVKSLLQPCTQGKFESLLQPCTKGKFEKKFAATQYKGEIWVKVCCSPVQRGNLRKSLLQPCTKGKFEKKFAATLYKGEIWIKVCCSPVQGEIREKVCCSPVQRGNLRKSLVQPCTKGTFEKKFGTALYKGEIWEKVWYSHVQRGNLSKTWYSPVQGRILSPMLLNFNDWAAVSHPSTNRAQCGLTSVIYTGAQSPFVKYALFLGATEASKQPRRLDMTSELNSVTSTTYVVMLFWPVKASLRWFQRTNYDPLTCVLRRR